MENKHLNNLHPLSKLIALSMMLGLTSFAHANSGVSEVSGVVPNTLPQATMEDFNNNTYPRPGDLTVSTVQFCGDADVAHYASTHKNVDFVTNGKVKFVLGRWTVSDPGKVPSKDNFIPLGYTELHSDGGHTIKLKDMKGVETKGMTLVQKELNLIKRMTGMQMSSTRSGEKSYTYMGMMMCKDFTVDKRTGANAYSLAKYFGNILSIHKPILTNVASGDLESASKFDVSLTTAGPTITLGKGDNTVKSHPLYRYAKTLSSAKPGDAEIASLSGLIKKIKSATSCNNINEVATKTKSGRYWWEHVALGASCRSLNVNFQKSYQIMYSEDAKADPSIFQAEKNEVVSRLIASAIMNQVQNDLHNNTVNNRQQLSCVPSSGDYVDKIMGSIVFDLKNAKKTSYKMIHPEGNFAIGGDKPYRGGGGNAYTVFSMSGGGTPIESTPGIAPELKDISTKALDLNFKVRGVGCSKNIYCQNELFDIFKDRS